jgi:diguanylate cyclase (GGDEF)-like protein
MDLLTPGQVGTHRASDALVLSAVRRLMRVTTDEEIVGVLIDAVRDLGGTVISAHHQRASTIAIDLSLGIGEPMLADVADPNLLSGIRRALEPLMDDARLALNRLKAAPYIDVEDATDPLTGLGNWTATMVALMRMLPGDGIALFHIENLKHVNDTYGVTVGDQVLLSFARTLRRAARGADSVGRVGGTEFVWLLGGSGLIGAESALARLRTTWQQDRPHPVTYAAGLALVGASGPNEAYMQADVVVQNAKRMGLDQTGVSR